MKNMFTKYVRIRKELCNMNTDKEFDRESMSFQVGRQVVGRQEVGRQVVGRQEVGRQLITIYTPTICICKG